MTEMRCGDCIELGIECPRGYYGGACKCDVCGYRFALASPNCAPDITCPECKGTIEYEDR
jgi:hypothetical protein